MRAQLERLAADVLVEHATTPDGIGRPRQIWSLTAKGHGRFPDTHAQMTVELIEAVRDEFGEAGLARLVGRREQAMAAHYEQALRGAGSLEERVARLVGMRSAEGYMAEFSRGEAGALGHRREPLPDLRRGDASARGSAAPSSRCSPRCSRRHGWSASSTCSRDRGVARMW